MTLLILLLVGVILLRRHRSAGRKATETRGNDTVSLPDSVIDPNRPVLIENFSDHYRIMSADSDFRFSEEFEELKHVGRDQPCTFADLPCNRPKNRFTNILPYDHSRFKLQPVDDEEGSDYINANYVPVSLRRDSCMLTNRFLLRTISPYLITWSQFRFFINIPFYLI